VVRDALSRADPTAQIAAPAKLAVNFQAPFAFQRNRTLVANLAANFAVVFILPADYTSSIIDGGLLNFAYIIQGKRKYISVNHEFLQENTARQLTGG